MFWFSVYLRLCNSNIYITHFIKSSILSQAVTNRASTETIRILKMDGGDSGREATAEESFESAEWIAAEIEKEKRMT